jgi:uncharacterized protein (DUF1697 family)
LRGDRPSREANVPESDRRTPFHAVGAKDERKRLGTREIFVHYGRGMGKSKLRIPAAKTSTARNMNTVAKLAEMASKL